eukprot:snap_masked-scaffold_17-processed-gene-5.25-mRNA-1 protein AED:1.00 eAED:1.00 QI:0/-1/0/0/-1/1/1/0/117
MNKVKLDIDTETDVLRFNILQFIHGLRQTKKNSDHLLYLSSSISESFKKIRDLLLQPQTQPNDSILAETQVNIFQIENLFKEKHKNQSQTEILEKLNSVGLKLLSSPEPKMSSKPTN